MSTRLRIAILTSGGVAGPASPVDIPAHRDFIERISAVHDVSVFSLNVETRSQVEMKCGEASLSILPTLHRDSLLRKAAAFTKAFLKANEKQRFNIIHGFWGLPGGAVAVALGRLTNIPTVVSFFGGESANLSHIGYGNSRSRLSRALIRWTGRNADLLLLQSEYQHAQLARLKIVARRSKIVPFGATAQFYSHRKNGSFLPPYRFLHVAALARHKNPQMLLRAFSWIRRHVDCSLRIIGPNYLDGQLPALARELGIDGRVEFLGYRPHAEMPDHYRWADFFIQSSYHEGGGVAVAEAAASGLALCGTRVGLMADLEYRGSICVEPDDHGALAAAIIEVLKNPERLNYMRRFAARWADTHNAKWTANTVLESYESLYKDFIDRRL